MQQAEMTVTAPEAARALRDLSLLGYFLEPESPSEVAKRTGQPANLVHHHAKRALELGLLVETKREGGKVYYQLAARTFKHARDLLDPEETPLEDMQQLSKAFVNAYARSDRIAGHLDPEYATYGFGKADGNPLEHRPQYTPFASDEARPAHFHARTLRLSAGNYRKLVQQISNTLLEAQADTGSDAGVCSFAVLAFDGPIREGDTDAQHINSYLALPNT